MDDDGSSRKRPRAASIVTGAEDAGSGEGTIQFAEEPTAEESGEDVRTEAVRTDFNALENGDRQTQEDEDDDEEDDEVLVVLELTDFKNHPIFDDHRHLTIEVCH